MIADAPDIALNKSFDAASAPQNEPTGDAPATDWTLAELTDELEARGVVLWKNAVGNLVATPAKDARDLKTALLAHKPALLDAIPFQRSGQAKKVKLALLGETIWLASDNWNYTPDEPKRPHLFHGLVVYRCREMEQLFAFSPHLRALAQAKTPATGAWAEALSLIHAVKRDVGGEIVGAEE